MKTILSCRRLLLVLGDEFCAAQTTDYFQVVSSPKRRIIFGTTRSVQAKRRAVVTLPNGRMEAFSGLSGGLARLRQTSGLESKKARQRRAL